MLEDQEALKPPFRALSYTRYAMSLTTFRLPAVCVVLVTSCTFVAHDRRLEETDGGGGGAGGGTGCSEGETIDCYDGSEETESVGVCRAGVSTCTEGAFGACFDQVMPGLERCDSGDDVDCDGFAECQGHTLWSISAGDAAIQEVRALAIDHSGNVIIAGYFGGTLAFDATSEALESKGGADIFVAELSPAGDQLWANGYGDALNQVPARMAIAVDDADNVYVGGMVIGDDVFGTSFEQEDGFVIKLGADGEKRAQAQIGGPGLQRIRDLVIDPASQEIVVLGDYTESTMVGGAQHTTSGGISRALLLRFDTGANRLWSHDFGNDAADTMGSSVAVSAGGEIAVAVVAVAPGVDPFDAGGPALQGITSPCVARFDPSGNLRASKCFGVDGMAQVRSIAYDGDGDLVLGVVVDNGGVDLGAGVLSYPGDAIYIAKLAPDFTPIGATMALEDADRLGDLHVGPDGYVAMTGAIRRAHAR